LRKDGVETPTEFAVTEMFQSAGIARLKEILSIEPNEISRHTLEGVSPLQAERIQEALLSASSTEVICETEDLDADAGFSAALLRQLGLTLISWNYPEVYQRAVRCLEDFETLDLAIASLLGYSPTMLAIRLVKGWGLPTELSSAVYCADEISTEEDSATANAVGSVIGTICRISEALARANNPQIYPHAVSDWHEARQAIEERLGTTALSAIQARFEVHCLGYLESVPDIFRAGMLVNPEMQFVTSRQASMLGRNPFVERCRPHLRTRLLSLYAELAGGKLDRVPLHTLLHDVIPVAGFTGGCVFTVDPAIKKLVAQTVIGEPVVRKCQPVEYHDATDTVSIAFESQTPLVIEEPIDPTLGSDTYMVLAWALGFSQRVGVLYLEMPSATFRQSAADQMTHFNALCQALNDCLGLH